MKNEQILSLLNQIQNGIGIGKLTQSENLDSKTKMKLFRLITEIKESNAAKSLVEYQQSLQNRRNEDNASELNAEFMEVLKQETDFEPRKVEFPIEEAAECMSVNEMDQAGLVLEFVDTEE